MTYCKAYIAYKLVLKFIIDDSLSLIVLAIIGLLTLTVESLGVLTTLSLLLEISPLTVESSLLFLSLSSFNDSGYDFKASAVSGY
jgi:hypothetical protein